MITVAQQLSAIGPQAIKTVADHEAALTGLVGADVAEKWAGLTSEQAWKDLQATTGIYKGFSREAILNGQVSTDIPYQMAFKLSMGLKTIDFENEPVSFGGLRKSVDASLPSTLDALEAKDPEKGKAARTLLYVATGKAARQYEAQIAAEEQRFGMSFNPRVRGYTFNYATIADENNRQIISRLVEEQYGGDIIRAVEDKFARAGGGALRYGMASTTVGAALAALPSVDDMKRLLDLRNSAVYLDSLSRKIEPEDFRVAREMGMDAFSTTEAQAIGAGAIEAIATAPLPGEITTETIPAGGAGSQSVGSVTAQLLDKFEGGGDYDALFGFANREGGPFAGTKVSEMTIGELKDFSNGEYADYSRQQLGYKATPMGRFQFVGTTLSDVAKRMGLGDDTVFTPQVQNDMFIFLAKDVMAGKSASGKRTAMRQTWEGLRNASDAELNQMIAEIEGGKASFGTTGTTGGTFRGARPTEANAAAAAAGGAVQRAVASTPSASMTMPSGEAPTEAAAATLPEAIPTTTPENQAVSTPEGQAPVVDKDVQAFIQEIAGDPDKTFASDAEFLAAQERGELEAGDTVVVDGDIYVIRKNGTARRLGSVNA